MITLSKRLPALKLSAQGESWPIAGSFAISRGAKTEAEVITVTLDDGAVCGRGECVPYLRYEETVSGVLNAIEKAAPLLASRDICHADVLQSVEQGAARNAIDCAIWDYFAKASNQSIVQLAGLPPLEPQITAYTISLGSPGDMAEKTRQASHYDLLKIKLGGEGDEDRMRAVREAAPNSRLIGDANEGWAPDILPDLLMCAKENGFELIEQPLPESQDHLLEEINHPIPICADESCHDSSQLEDIARRYDAINIKLDKTGGFGEALNLTRKAKAMNLKIMIGCMVGTSLAMAPALYLSEYADWIDLDGPLLLSEDRVPGLEYSGSTIMPPSSSLWG